MTNDREFIEVLRSKLTDTNHPTLGSHFYEWKIEDWNSLINKECVDSPTFQAFGYTWNLELYPTGVDHFYRNNVSLYLRRRNEKDDFSVHIPVNRVFFIRNYYDKYCYCAQTLPIEYLSKSIPSCGHPNLIKNSELFTKNPYTNKSIIENNKCIVGVYFEVYQREKGQFKKEVMTFVDDEDKVVKDSLFYEFKVKKWNSLSKAQSPKFRVGDYKWALDVHRSGDGGPNMGYVSVYLVCLTSDLKKDGVWANATIFLRENKDDPEVYCFDVLEMRNFNKKVRDCGFSQLAKKKDLYTSKFIKRSIIDDDNCIAGVYLHVYEKGKVKPTTVNNTPFSSGQPIPTYSPVTTQPMNNAIASPQSPPYPSTTYPSTTYPNPAYPSQAYPNPVYPNPAYPNPAYPNPAYPNPAYPSQAYPNPAFQPYQYPPNPYATPYYYPPGPDNAAMPPMTQYPPPPPYSAPPPYSDPPSYFANNTREVPASESTETKDKK